MGISIKEAVLEAASGSEDVNTYLRQVIENGCQSGMVSELIYYKDTIAFFRCHTQEINTIISMYTSDVDLHMAEVFNAWDRTDALALDTHNQNLLAWFAYEQVARQILDERENS